MYEKTPNEHCKQTTWLAFWAVVDHCNWFRCTEDTHHNVLYMLFKDKKEKCAHCAEYAWKQTETFFFAKNTK